MERFVFEESLGVLHDLRDKAPGRGAYVHATPNCLAKAARFGFCRGFRRDVELAPEEFVDTVRSAIRTRLEETARLAVRSGAAAVGQRSVEEAIKTSGADLLIVACDAGDATKRKYRSNAERKNLPVIDRLDGATLAAWSGREFVSTMTMSGRLAQRFARDMAHLEQLGFFEG
jgi:predicted RNA-binding protein YlxR (DUF448 family)